MSAKLETRRIQLMEKVGQGASAILAPTVLVDAIIVGRFGVHSHRTKPGWTATLICNGQTVLRAKTKTQAVKLAGRMDSVDAPWDSVGHTPMVTDWPKLIMDQVFAIRDEGMATFIKTRKPPCP